VEVLAVNATTKVIEAARKVIEDSHLDYRWDYNYCVKDDAFKELDAALKAYDAVIDRTGPVESLPTFLKDGWSMKFEDCGPSDPGAIQCMNGGAAPSWMRKVE
jgi:hypothetical protein